jgi:hypothetical protein
MIRHFPVRFRCLYGIAVLLCSLAVAVPTWAQFETRATAVLPNESFAVAVGDFNHDGKLDVAVVGDYLSIFLGNGNGTFKPPINYLGPFYSIAVADFNNDGNLDIVVGPDADNISVFLGIGDGTFQPPISSPTTYGCSVIAVGDFNGDGKMDIVASDYLYISVLLGNGDGTFQAPINNSSFAGPGELAVGDLNNDHLLDVAVVGGFGNDSGVGVLLGNGDGTLQDAITYPLSVTTESIAAGAFRRSANLDLAIGTGLDAGVLVLLGNGDGSFQPPKTYPGGAFPVIVGDFNGDGKLDLIAGALSGGGVAEFLGNGNGTFQAEKTYLSGNGILAETGDLNGDGKLDAVLLDTNHDTITTMLNTGALAFSPTTPLNFGEQLIGTTSKPQIVTIRNTGSKAISFRSIRASGPFQAADTCGGAIAAGAACKISATFTPSKAGSQSGEITVIDSASSKPQYIELSGVGKK